MLEQALRDDLHDALGGEDEQEDVLYFLLELWTSISSSSKLLIFCSADTWEMKNTKQIRKSFSPQKKQQTGENVQLLKNTQSGVFESRRHVNFFPPWFDDDVDDENGDDGVDDENGDDENGDDGVDRENGDDDVDDENGDDGGIMWYPGRRI